jgi:regulatory protein YycH of two-component signal transduction system YycFG
MSYENIKSILLTSLVILSLVFTWSLWTYQPHYEKIENTEYIKDVNIGLKKEAASIILPNKLLFHKNNNHYGTVKEKPIKDMMRTVREWSFDEFTDITATVGDGYLDFIHGQEGVEVIFPSELPIETLRGIINIEDEEIRSKTFDRIVIHVNENQDKSPYAYFVSYANHYVYRTKLNNFSSQVFEKEVFNLANNYPKYFSFKIDANTSLFIPEDAVEADQVTYYSRDFSGEDFKDALFTDPRIVKSDVQPSGDQVYSDGSRALTIYNGGLLRYITPSSESRETTTVSHALIQKSIDFVNDHSGWTEMYQLTDWNIASQSTTFRLHINGLPVFNYRGLSRLSMHWDGRNLFDIYERPIFKLHLSINSESSKVNLPSGYRLIEQLKQTPSFDLLKLEDALVGYEMKKDQTSAKVIVEPIWCIKHNGVWKKVIFEDDLGEQGGTFIELE